MKIAFTEIEVVKQFTNNTSKYGNFVKVLFHIQSGQC